MEEEIAGSQENQEDFIQEVKDFFINLHSEGVLSLYALLITVLYNLLIFDYPFGYELYFFIPVFGLLIGYLTSYWKTSSKTNFYFGIFIVFFVLLFDLMVSISYLWGSPNDYSSIPTVLTDLIGSLSLILWIYTLDVETKFTNFK